MSEMRVLSLQQPWAWLVVHGLKPIENRGWPTAYRGELAIHASLRPDTGYAAGRFPLPAGVVVPPLETLPRGAIVGLCRLTDCVTDSADPWFDGPFGFVIADAVPIAPIPWRGALGLRRLPPEIAERVRALAVVAGWTEAAPRDAEDAEAAAEHAAEPVCGELDRHVP